MTQASQVIAIIVGVLNILTILGVGARFFNGVTKRLDRIEYALYNDGKTGLVQEQQEQGRKIDSFMVEQQKMRIDLEVMKVKYSI